MKPIKKAVFPVAGLGTRFLPATKATPKEMMPLVDKPLIQYAVEEAIEAGVTELIFVTSSTKRAIEDHFDSNFELETNLQERNKTELLKMVRDILPPEVSCSYVRQKRALGLGHAVLCAAPLVGDEPFAVLLADDFIDAANKGCLTQLAKTYEETQSCVIAVETIAMQDTNKYGVVNLADNQNTASKITGIVEKPESKHAPSNLGVVGRYILMPTIFRLLHATLVGTGGEIQLTDAIASLLNTEDVYAHKFTGTRYDCGSKLGYLEATLACAMQHPELKQDFKKMLQKYTTA